MTYALTRRAANASWSDRTAKVGKPAPDLHTAILRAAAAAADHGTIKITEIPDSGLHASVSQAFYAGATRTIKTKAHITLTLPSEWLGVILPSASAIKGPRA